jgi:hypothetical protein
MDSDNPSGADNQQETSEFTYSTTRLDPNWVVGFVDGEGCFSVSLHRNPRFARRTAGWQLHATFHVYQHNDYLDLLCDLKTFFGCGNIRGKGPRSSVSTFAVDSLGDLSWRIIPFFKQHPPRVKLHDFLIFADIVESMKARKHWNTHGLVRLVRLAYSMNANGKQRARDVEEVIAGILRDCTPGPVL